MIKEQTGQECERRAFVIDLERTPTEKTRQHKYANSAYEQNSPHKKCPPFVVKLDLQLADIEAHFFGQVVVGRILASGLLGEPSEMVQLSLFIFCDPSR